MSRSKARSIIAECFVYVLIAVAAITVGGGGVFLAKPIFASNPSSVRGDFSGLAASVGQGKPIMVVLPGCPHCEDARVWLAAKQISVKEIVIGTDARVQAVLEANKLNSTPTLIQAQLLTVGFSANRWETLFPSHGD